MLIVLSPAKTLDFETPVTAEVYSQPEFLDRAAELIAVLQRLSPAQIGSLMQISDPLAALNAGRYAAWSAPHAPSNARQAALAFNGDVYEGLDAASLAERQLAHAQQHLRILSGLYGILRPLDLMQAYRLEMGTRLATARGKDLYAFWGGAVTDALRRAMREHGHTALVNLASEEYFKAVRPERLQHPVITPVFEDWKGGRFKIISFHAKRARGLMARFAAVEGIADAERLKEFNIEGYAFAPQQSTGARWVFRRRLED